MKNSPYSSLLSVIVPCFNEQDVIESTYRRLKDVMVNHSLKHEIIFINDGSRDSTPAMLEDIARKDAAVKVIHFSRNFGHQPAVSAGIVHCNGESAVIIDADLQDPPELIPDMIQKHMEEKANVVYCVRRARKGEGWLKRGTAKLFYRILNSLSEVKLPLDTGDFRLIDRTVIDTFKNFPEKDKYIRGLISWMGFQQTPFYYDRDPRLSGKTKYNLRRMFRLAFTGLFYFSRKPLKIALNLGFLSILIGLGLIIYIVISRLSHTITTVPGWASTLITIVFFGGVQLLTIGVLGEYVASIFDEVKGRPEFIIGRMTNFDSGKGTARRGKS